MASDPISTTSEHETSTVTTLEHLGYRIQLHRTHVDWIGFVTGHGQRPTVILAPDRDALIANAHAWIDDQINGSPAWGEASPARLGHSHLEGWRTLWIRRERETR